MTDVYNQFYVSPLLLGTSIQIPDGTIPAEWLEETWVRTIAYCIDLSSNHDIPVEAKSNRFNRLVELLDECDECDNDGDGED